MNIKKSLVWILLSVCLLASCSKPQVDEEERAVNQSGGNISVSNLYEMKNYTNSFFCNDQRVEIEIQAEAFVAKNADLLISVVPHEIKSNEVKKVANILFGCNEINECYYFSTTQQIEEKINVLKSWIDDLNPNDELYEYRFNLWNDWIRYYQEQERQLTLKSNNRETDWTFKSPNEYSEWPIADNTMKELKVTASVGDLNGFLDCNVLKSDECYLNHLLFWVQDGYQNYEIEENRDEVISFVNNNLEQMGLGKWTIIDCVKREYKTDGSYDNYFNTSGFYYELIVRPVYESLIVPWIPQLVASANMDEIKYRYHLEELTIHYSSGRIVLFDWMAPLDQIQANRYGTSLIDFNDVIDLFEINAKKCLTVENIWGYSIENKSIPEKIKIDIKKITNGYLRKRNSNDQMGYTLVPAWFFQGDIYVVKDGKKKALVKSEETNGYPLMVIDAITGKVESLSNLY